MHARCACGALGAETDVEPLFVIACHCVECQRRTGAPFGVSVYYPRGEVAVSGSPSEYARATDSGGVLRNRFCATCGGTLFWTIDAHPELIGVAMGGIEDPKPTISLHSLWEQSKLDGISLDAATQHHQRGYPAPD